MLYLFHGSDMQKVRSKAGSILSGLLKKQPDASVIRVATETCTEDAIVDVLGTQGLFFGKAIVVFDDVLGDTDIRDMLKRHLKEMSASDNIFIFINNMPGAPALKLFEKHGAKIEEVHSKTKSAIAEKPNLFALGDAYGTGNFARTLYVYYTLRGVGVAPEEIHGTLLWQVKTLLMVLKGGNEKDLPVKDFPRRKAMSALKNHTEERLENHFLALLNIPYTARAGGGDFEIMFESWLVRLSMQK